VSDAYPGRLTVIGGDAMEMDYRLLADGPTRIVANLPYNIGTQLLTGWLTMEPWPPFFESLTLMFQREVAERIVARPGDNHYGRLGVLAGWRADARIAFNVGKQAFVPPPSVTSAVVHIVPKPVEEGLPVRLVEQVTKAAFGQRRKMVRQSLKSLGVPVEALLAAADLKGDERAETLPIEAFLAMARALPGLRAEG
jgi:16S rRNA (adenine1518-N6/adenine1519-N6)-dimethyltransferase